MIENSNWRERTPEQGLLLGGRYQVERMLGSGAAVQYLCARDTERGDGSVVVHRFQPCSVVRGMEMAQAASWFLETVERIQTLKHLSINPPLAAWQDPGVDGALYVVTEYVPGNTLDQELTEAEEPISWRQVVDIGVALATLLEYLHSQTNQPLSGMLRPQRIVLDARNGMPVLVGFGIDSQLEAGAGDRPAYMPFELWVGRQDSKSDVYSLGMILGTMITNQQPDAIFSRLRRSGLDVQRSMRGTAESIASTPRGVPSALGEIITRATAFTPSDRFQSAGAFAEALRMIRGPEVESLSNIVAEPEEGPIWERVGLTREAYYALSTRERNALVLTAFKPKPPILG